MNNWPYSTLSAFLAEREGRYKPNDPKICSYKRLEKIDFTGKIHISEKSSKTNMIIIVDARIKTV
jgi:type I restriction enzyme, S subunit